MVGEYANAEAGGALGLPGYQPRRAAPSTGRRLITATDKPDEFQTETRYVQARTGATVRRTGKSLVYTGFQWRGRSGEGNDTMREVMLLDRNQRELTGRWFNGGYEETGIDVTMTPAGQRPNRARAGRHWPATRAPRARCRSTARISRPTSRRGRSISAAA